MGISGGVSRYYTLSQEARMRYSRVFAFLIFTTAILMVAGTSQAYTSFSGSNNCDQCHTGFDSYGAATHQSHIASFACGDCHVSNGDNPEVSTCSACHDSNLLWNFHLQFAGNDLNGMDCNACHTVTSTEKESWDSIKSRYRAALYN